MALGVRGNNMALLTEVQIHEVAAIFAHRRDANIATIFHAIKEWNEKQQSFIEPNWNRLPSKIKYCHLRHYYFDDIGNEIDWQFIISYERPVTPHPHAGIIMKYAEVAQRRTNPWVEFEIKDPVTRAWTALNIPITFFEECEYRYTGDDK